MGRSPAVARISWRPRFSSDDAAGLAEQYWHVIRAPDKQREVEIERFQPEVRRRGFLKIEEFRLVAEWKSSRIRGHIRKVSQDQLTTACKRAFSSSKYQSAMEHLDPMSGVDFATGSVILHFFHPRPMPIWDFRTFWSLGQEHELPTRAAEKRATWVSYCQFAVNMAEQWGVPMRALDRALWTYSKLNQPAGQGRCG